MKKQVATPLIKEINEKLSELSPEIQQQILAYMNYLIIEEENKNANDYPSSSDVDLTTCMTE